MACYLNEGDVAISCIPKFREYGISVGDGGSSHIKLRYCPWCGIKLPQDLRNEWFDQLERLGHDPLAGDLPEEFQSDAWWKAKEL
jgi:hypothetical protein